MTIQIKTGIKCKYTCSVCGIDYSEQRDITESQFFTTCQNFGCSGTYELINSEEFTYEVDIPEPIIDVEVVEPTPELE
jgi:hypothetical protein